MKTYAALSPARRVSAVDMTCRALWKAFHWEPPQPVSPPSEIWLERVKKAAVDPDVSDESVGDLAEPFHAYAKGLDQEERLALYTNLKHFLEVVELMPPDAQGPQAVEDRILELQRQRLEKAAP